MLSLFHHLLYSTGFVYFITNTAVTRITRPQTPHVAFPAVV